MNYHHGREDLVTLQYLFVDALACITKGLGEFVKAGRAIKICDMAG